MQACAYADMHHTACLLPIAYCLVRNPALFFGGYLRKLFGCTDKAQAYLVGKQLIQAGTACRLVFFSFFLLGILRRLCAFLGWVDHIKVRLRGLRLVVSPKCVQAFDNALCHASLGAVVHQLLRLCQLRGSGLRRNGLG